MHDDEIRSRLIVALDEDSLSAAEQLMDRLGSRTLYYKVGLQLFTAAGTASIAAVKARGARVFLDLKLHDIPNTVASAIRSARKLGVDLCTIHLSGGQEMCAAAVAEAGDNLGVLGVTVLTSTNDLMLRASGVVGNVADHVMRLADIGYAAGVDGFVSSALESPQLRKRFGPSVILVTPGVRRLEAKPDDQKRIVTPAEAVRRGATYLVIGRPITRATDPLAAFESLVKEMWSAGKIKASPDEVLSN